jgi:phage gpG-like protein
VAKITGSNRDAVAAEVAGLARAFGLRRRGRYRTLADDVRTLVAEAVYDQTVLAQKQPDGSPLAPLAPSTLAEKRLRGYPETILVRTGHMLDLEQLKGEMEASDTSLAMTYGTDEEARQLAEYAHEGSRKKVRRPKRPFYALDDKGEKDLGELMDEALGNQAGDAGFNS